MLLISTTCARAAGSSARMNTVRVCGGGHRCHVLPPRVTVGRGCDQQLLVRAGRLLPCELSQLSSSLLSWQLFCPSQMKLLSMQSPFLQW